MLRRRKPSVTGGSGQDGTPAEGRTGGPAAPVRTARAARRGWALIVLAVALAFFLGVYTSRHWDQERLVDKTNPPSYNTSDMLERILEDLNVHLEGFLASMPSIATSFDQQTREGTDTMEVLEDLTPKHPVIIIPGMTNTPLTMYKGRKCAQKWLRMRLWGPLSSTAHAFATNCSCWLEHLETDEESGLDPPGIRVRPNVDISDIETVFGVDMWRMMVDKLVAVGYDSNNIVAMPYDWRLSPNDVERRDGFLTRLRLTIEFQYTLHQEKVVIMCHSYGGILGYHFLTWVEEQAGPGWVEKYVAVFMPIAAPLLGVPKALTALLSGESKDTAGLGNWGVQVADMVIPRKPRLRLMRSFGCLIGMLPQGGNTVWGSLGGDSGDGAIDKCKKSNMAEDREPLEYGAMITLKRSNGTVQQLDAEAAARLLIDSVSTPVRERIRRNGALHAGVDGFSGKGEAFRDAWSTPLPDAPSLRIVCTYGVSMPTERRFYYRELSEEEDPQSKGVNVTIDVDLNKDEHCVSKGVGDADGDGSVNLVSLGLMCRKWAKGKTYLNPSGLEVTTVEILGSTAPSPWFSLPKGPTSTPDSQDHLGIMANKVFLGTAVHVAAGHLDDIHDVFHSPIEIIAERIPAVDS